MPGLKLACGIVSVILFVLAAIPPLPYTSTLLALGLAFHAASELV